MIIDDEQHAEGSTTGPDDKPVRETLGDVATVCPDCGVTLVRPNTFSADRLLHLHRKWGACFPPGTATETAASPGEAPVLHVDGVTRQGRRPA
ncbi:MAG TPA: hypothetical protein VFP54_09025 [Acidimicrobiales bacterium]|nr:hypothetical protein [Acidimicrobiales bacterium]